MVPGTGPSPHLAPQTWKETVNFGAFCTPTSVRFKFAQAHGAARDPGQRSSISMSAASLGSALVKLPDGAALPVMLGSLLTAASAYWPSRPISQLHLLPSYLGASCLCRPCASGDHAAFHAALFAVQSQVLAWTQDIGDQRAAMLFDALSPLPCGCTPYRWHGHRFVNKFEIALKKRHLAHLDQAWATSTKQDACWRCI